MYNYFDAAIYVTKNQHHDAAAKIRCVPDYSTLEYSKKDKPKKAVS